MASKRAKRLLELSRQPSQAPSAKNRDAAGSSGASKPAAEAAGSCGASKPAAEAAGSCGASKPAAAGSSGASKPAAASSSGALSPAASQVSCLSKFWDHVTEAAEIPLPKRAKVVKRQLVFSSPVKEALGTDVGANDLQLGINLLERDASFKGKQSDHIQAWIQDGKDVSMQSQLDPSSGELLRVTAQTSAGVPVHDVTTSETAGAGKQSGVQDDNNNDNVGSPVPELDPSRELHPKQSDQILVSIQDDKDVSDMQTQLDPSSGELLRVTAQTSAGVPVHDVTTRETAGAGKQSGVQDDNNNDNVGSPVPELDPSCELHPKQSDQILVSIQDDKDVSDMQTQLDPSSGELLRVTAQTSAGVPVHDVTTSETAGAGEQSGVQDDNNSDNVVYELDPVSGELRPIQLIHELDQVTGELRPISLLPAAEDELEYELDPATGILQPVGTENQADILLDMGDQEIDNVVESEEQTNEILDAGSDRIELGDVIDQADHTPQPRKRNQAPRETASRKKITSPSTWICNQRKVAKNSGKGFILPNGKVIKPAVMRNACSCSRLKCFQKFSEDRRRQIFDSFYAIADHTRQWDYITRHSHSTPTKKKTVGDDSRRKTSRKYFFLDENGSKIEVCKFMFMSTLGIWEGWIQSAYNHISGGTTESMSPDKRGRHPNRPHKISEAQLATVTTHINKYPRVPSHYCRSRSKREYVEHGLNRKKMGRHYKEWCEQESISKEERATARMYKDIFNTKFNIGFHKPKKDRCTVCSIIKSCTRNEREQMALKYAQHIKFKQDSKKMRLKNKDEATKDRSILYCAFDLEKILVCPKSNISDFFYESKMSVFNFTVFNIITLIGSCYVWDEVTAKKGSNEVSSCFLQFIEAAVNEGNQQGQPVKEVRSFSDSTGSQNRNRMVFAMFHLAAVRFNIKIRHMFMEPGHTFNENDQVHARIETSSEDIDIFNTEEWLEVIRTAKVEEPMYRVTRMEQKDFLDFHALVDAQNWKYDDKGKEIKWSKVKIVEVDGQFPNVVKFKPTYGGEFMTLNLKSRKGRPVNVQTYQLKRAYFSPFRLSVNKMKSIEKLCRSLAIPSKYHAFWNNILESSKVAENREAEEEMAAEAAEDSANEEEVETDGDGDETDNDDDEDDI